MLNRPLPRVYPILDTAALERLAFHPVHAAAALLEGGARILQFRHKGFWSREVFAQAEEIAALCARRPKADFIVNDRADYAAFFFAPACTSDSMIFSRRTPARVIGDTPTIGYSTHNPDQMRAAASEPVDYVAFGPVLGTASKDRPDPMVGIDGPAYRAQSPLPNPSLP